MKKLTIIVVLALAGALFVGATGIFPGPVPTPPPQTSPLRSGFFGQARSLRSGGPGNDQNPDQGIPIKCYVSIYNSNGILSGRIVSNPVGQFYSYLPPGTYTVIATLPSQRLPPRLLKGYVPPDHYKTTSAEPVNITVLIRTLTETNFAFYNTNGA